MTSKTASQKITLTPREGTEHSYDVQSYEPLVWHGVPYRAAVVDVRSGEPWVFFVQQTKQGRDYKSKIGTWLTISNSLRPFGTNAHHALANRIETAIKGYTP